MPFLIGGMNMDDMEFIETLKEKRNACGYSQTRLAKELHISRQNLNEIENGKTRYKSQDNLTNLLQLSVLNFFRIKFIFDSIRWTINIK